jgi:hypothetical protein
MMDLWSLLNLILLVLCQLFELLQLKLQLNQDHTLNFVQFYKLSSIQFSYKRSYGSCLWNHTICYSKTSAHIYDDLHDPNLKFIDMTISEEMEDLYQDLTKSFLMKIFYNKFFFLKWLKELITTESSTPTPTETIGVEISVILLFHCPTFTLFIGLG